MQSIDLALKKINIKFTLFYSIYDYISLWVILNQTIVLFLIYIIIITKEILKNNDQKEWNIYSSWFFTKNLPLFYKSEKLLLWDLA